MPASARIDTQKPQTLPWGRAPPPARIFPFGGGVAAGDGEGALKSFSKKSEIFSNFLQPFAVFYGI